MADGPIKEEVIVDVKIEGADSEKQVSTLTKRIGELKNQNVDLNKTNKDLEKQGKANTKEYIDNAKQIEINKQKITENTASRKSLITTIIAEDNSIKALQARNRELVKQRNEISTSTAEGRAQIALLNQQIDKNNDTIRTNVSGLEKQKINIGNYASALDGVIPGLSGVVTGTKAMTAASATFIATPIGAIIGAIGLALGALIAYFKGSEEGQNRLNRIMNVGGAIMEKLMDVVEGLGGALFDAAENPKQAFLDLVNFIKDNLINRFTAVAVIVEGIANLDFKKIVNGTIQLTTGVQDVIGKVQNFGKEVAKQADDAFARAERLSVLQEKLNKQERELILNRARTERDVAKLIVESQELEGEARLAKINEALALEKKLLEAEKTIASTRLALAKMAVEDDPTIENKKAYNEAVAGQYKAELDFFNGIRRLDRQRLSAQDEAQKERLKLYEDYLERQHELFSEEQAVRDEKEAKEQELHDRVIARMERERKQREKNTEDNIKAAEKELAFQRMVATARINLADTIGNVLGQLAGKNKALAITGILIEKAAAIAGIISNTAIANLKAIAASPLTFGQPWVSINTATGVVAGIGVAAQAAKSVSDIGGFAGGGLTGTRIMNHHGTPVNSSNGDNRLATVRTGEVILNERQQAALGGADTFRRIGVPGFADGGFTGFAQTSLAHRNATQFMDIERIVVSTIRSMPPARVLVTDINTAQNNFVQVTDHANL